jgi:hypothetical protein
VRYETADINLLTYGNKVAKQANAPILFSRTPRARATILIHGFNVNEAESLKLLGRFRDALGHFAPSIKRDIFICTWAGNWNLPVIRPAAYSFMLKNASETAETLIETFHEWYGLPEAPEELVIVAHSLGCKVILEMLAFMAKSGRPFKLKKLIVILMAAAVPVEHLIPGGKYHAALKVADTIVALHSPDDDILKPLIFGVGQTFGGDGRFPEAVGLHAHPEAAEWTAKNHMREYNHGDYWSEMETAQIVCGLLDIPIRPSERGPTLAARKLLDRRSLPVMPLLPG